MDFIDDLAKEFIFKQAPRRIVSLVPSITELLFDLGLENQIKAITRFCIHPREKCSSVDKIGGPKDFKIDKIKALNPDLIIAVKEENDKDLVLELSKTHPVIVFDVQSYQSAICMIGQIGRITRTETKANELLEAINSSRQALKLINKIPKTACYLIWNQPLMTINKQNYISEMLGLSGFINVFSDQTETYPQITDSEIEDLNPEYILLSSEPFPFNEKYQQQFQNKFPNAKVILVDGEMFSWYGSRMIKAFHYFTKCP